MKCWYCKEPDMLLVPELGKDWFQCSRCGATHQDKPLKASRGKLVEVENNPIGQETKYTPSHSVITRARKAREGKK